MIPRPSTLLCRWTLTDDSGAAVSDGGEALRGHVHGVTPVWAALESALDAAAEGDTVQFTEERPFGEPDPALRRSVPRGEWPGHVPAVVGPFAFRVDGQVEPATGHIVAVDAEHVHVDQNHPLAGMRITFAVEVLRQLRDFFGITFQIVEEPDGSVLLTCRGVGFKNVSKRTT